MPKITEKQEEMSITIIDNKTIPRNVIVETIFGCNANCTMCPISMPTVRKKGVMAEETFIRTIDGLAPYAHAIVQIDLFGVGEPLLDKNIVNRIRYIKKKGFDDVGFASNADLLTPEYAQGVFEAGLDTIMVSLDGATKEVHESIRVNTSFPRIVQNVKGALDLRNKQGYKTKFVMRFIRQPKNIHEWDSYREFWSPLISREKGDVIIGYDMHSWGGEIDVHERRDLASIPPEVACHHLFDRLIILHDGSVTMCCSDMHRGKHLLGNVTDATPIDIFNNAKMQTLRETHLNGKRLDMKICAACTILESESAKEVG